MEPTSEELNTLKFNVNSKSGHYESWFLRANHPSQPLAFWIKYTIHSPKGQPDLAVGEVWATYFDGINNQVFSTKEEFNINDCSFQKHNFGGKIGSSYLMKDVTHGCISDRKNNIKWSINYKSIGSSISILPSFFYKTTPPKSKLFSGAPFALFNGVIIVNDQQVSIRDWAGSENHNWGASHTDKYAWGQVVGFDNYSNAFLECFTANMKLGPIKSPSLTGVALRIDDIDYRYSSLYQLLKSKAHYQLFDWSFQTGDNDTEITGRIFTDNLDHIVRLTYKNPPGGLKTCLNTKLATCKLSVSRRGQKTITLLTQNRAAIEFLFDKKI